MKKGEEYDEDGRLSFEGEYSNGKKNEKGKEYDENGKLIYEGKYLNGERHEHTKEIEYVKLILVMNH